MSHRHLWLVGLLLGACFGENDTGLNDPGNPPEQPRLTDPGSDPENPFNHDCLVDQVHDPVAGFCVVPRGEGMLPEEGAFRSRHPWLAEAQSARETIRYVVPGLAAGGDGRPETPLGDWSAATAGLASGANVTFVIGRGELRGSLELEDLGRVTLVGNAATVSSLVGEDEPAIRTEGLGELRIWGLELSREGGDEGEEMGSAVELVGTGALRISQVLLSESNGHGLWVQDSGGDGVLISHVTIQDVAGDGISSQGALGWWTVDGSNLRGPMGADGISIIDFGGTQFRVVNSGFGGAPIGGSGISIVDFGGTQFRVTDSQFDGGIGSDGISIVDFGGSQFRVVDSQFNGPIGNDGISIVDFGGTQFRGVGNSFAEMGGSALSSTGGQGALHLQSNRMDGPIGRDGVTIVGFVGDDVTMRDMEVGQVGRIGISGADSMGSWTVDGVSFRGPIGFDGMQLRTVGESGKRVKLSNIDGEGVGRIGMRLIDGLGWWTVDGSNLRNTGDVGMEISGFGPDSSMDLNRVSVVGARGVGMMIEGSSALMEMTSSEIDDTIDGAQGLVPAPSYGYGLLVKDAARLLIRDNKLRRNAGPALVIDLTGWGARRDRPDLSGEGEIRLAGNEIEKSQDAPDEQPSAQAQNLPDEVDVVVEGQPPVQPNPDDEPPPNLPMPDRELDEPGCGDGVLDNAVEQCDDGNDVSNDACTVLCKVNVCGDGIVHSGVEQCDDGNEVNHGDGCSNDCVAPDRVPMPGGVFNMGHIGTDSQPFDVHVEPYSMSRTEVTCGEFEDYLRTAGPTSTVFEDSTEPEDGHNWHQFAGGNWQGNCIEPDGWPHTYYSAQQGAAEEGYDRALGTPLSTVALDLADAQAMPMDGENAFQYYYMVRRFRIGAFITGGYIDLYHPNAAIAVYVGGRLLHVEGMDGLGCDANLAALTRDNTEGGTRILLKPDDIEHLNYNRYRSLYISILLRPHSQETQDLGFAARFRIWHKTVAPSPDLPWIEGGVHRTAPRSAGPDGQQICGQDTYPVAMDWDQARDYCRWLGGDLPTAAQWEYAARNVGQDVLYPWGNRPEISRNQWRDNAPVACDYAHVSSDEAEGGCAQEGRRLPVCSKPLGHTEQGLCDMIGNLQEWTLDGSGQTPIQGEASDRPLQTPHFWYRLARFQLRGGSMANVNGASNLAAYNKARGVFSHNGIDFGFRCAWPAE